MVTIISTEDFDMTNNTISCIIPTFNRWNLLADRLIEISAFEEKSPLNIEVVIVDDHSDNPCPEIIYKFIESKNWKLIRLHKNSGSVSIPRSIGIINSSGEYIMHIDDDVKILESKFSILPKYFDSDSMMVYGGMLLQDSRKSPAFNYIFMNNYNPPNDGFGIDNSMIIYRRSVYKHIPIHFANRACDFVLASLISSIGKLTGHNMPVAIYSKDNNNNRSSNVSIKNINPSDYSLYFSSIDYNVDFHPFSGYSSDGILTKI